MTANITSALVAALDQTWQAIQVRHVDVPTVVVALGSGTMGARPGQERWGHFAAARWQHGERTLPELFVSGESLRHGAVDVLGTLLHEAAHGIAHVRHVRDTSRQGRYHNRRFKALGEELGLVLTEDPAIGWSVTHVPPETTAAYHVEIAALATAFVVYRHAETRASRSTRGTTNLAVATCGCPRRIRVAASVLAAAPITCGACGLDFRTQR